MTTEVTQLEAKPFYKSKLVWLAIATIFLGAIDQLNILGGLLPEQYQGIYTMIMGVLTLAARAVTGTSITLKK